jgi:GMP synthase-like glutamine amidotransferase
VTRIACLHHLEEPATGFAGEAIRSAGVELDERNLLRGDALPRLADVDGILTLGGLQSARDADEYDYLTAELDLLGEAATSGVPVFGVCLGGQMLARALGADVRRMPREIIAWLEAPPLRAAADDPVFSSWPAKARTLHWHEDEFDLPPGGVELMQRGGPGVEAFRHGDAAWGIQFHPEADSPTYGRWCETTRREELDAAGVTLDEVEAEGAAHMAEQERAALALFGAFATVVRRRRRRGRPRRATPRPQPFR